VFAISLALSKLAICHWTNLASNILSFFSSISALVASLVNDANCHLVIVHLYLSEISFSVLFIDISKSSISVASALYFSLVSISSGVIAVTGCVGGVSNESTILFLFSSPPNHIDLAIDINVSWFWILFCSFFISDCTSAYLSGSFIFINVRSHSVYVLSIIPLAIVLDGSAYISLSFCLAA